MYGQFEWWLQWLWLIINVSCAIHSTFMLCINMPLWVVCVSGFIYVWLEQTCDIFDFDTFWLAWNIMWVYVMVNICLSLAVMKIMWGCETDNGKCESWSFEFIILGKLLSDEVQTLHGCYIHWQDSRNMLLVTLACIQFRKEQ